MSDFVSYLANGLAAGCGFALVASGLVIIYRVTRVMNLAQGLFAVLAGLSASSFVDAGVPRGLAELAAIAVAAVAGGIVGGVATGKRGTSPEASLIVTLGLGIFGYAVEILIWGDQPRSFAGLAGAFEIAAAPIPKQYVLVAGTTVLVFGALEAFLERTYVGKGLGACASNPYAARLVGIDVRRMALLAFVIGGALGGLAGVLLTPLRPVTFDSDVALLVDGFAAAILGGLRRPLLVLGGGLVLGVSQAMAAGYVKGSYQTEVALVLMLAIMIRRARSSMPLLEEAV
jgi:branched-chain amino acid transport system permease protein